MIRELAGSLVEIDEKATLAWYESAVPWGCECGDCRKFVSLAEQGQLPCEVTELLDALHIPAAKATYVSLFYEDLYQFSYRIAGQILKQGPEGGSVLCGHETYPYGAPGFPEPHFDLEFFLKL